MSEDLQIHTSIHIQYFNGLLFSVIYCVCYYLFSYVLLIFAPFLHVTRFGFGSLSMCLYATCVRFCFLFSLFVLCVHQVCLLYMPLVCDLFSFLYLGKQISFSMQDFKNVSVVNSLCRLSPFTSQSIFRLYCFGV